MWSNSFARKHVCILLYLEGIMPTVTKDELIISRIYRMPIYRTFSYIEEYIVSNLPYRVSRYALDMPLFCLFPPKILRKIRKFSGNSENSPEIPKILRKFRKFAEISENSPKILKIRRKFIKKKVFLWGPDIVSYRIVSRKKPSYRIDIVSSRKKAYRYWMEGIIWYGPGLDEWKVGAPETIRIFSDSDLD